MASEKELLKRILEEQKRTNELLDQLIKRSEPQPRPDSPEPPGDAELDSNWTPPQLDR